ncbi:2823_t:CDS:2 [Paraglomus occultum]|uniref:2823_t:CDS:1 n=1 Tax=Paraglomus occultum TaxID=144539 RepID=A0A9N8VRF5_9GLOM|nr:2823_t:CDS:2 [Paraglomus occultum]
MTTLSTIPLFKLSIDTIYCIFDHLTSDEQLKFALSCSCIYRVFRIYYLGFYSPKWEEVQWTNDLNKKNKSVEETISTATTADITITTPSPSYSSPQPPHSPPPHIYRNAVLLNDKLYLPFLSPGSPYCYVLSLSGSPSQWTPCSLSIHPDSDLLYTPLLNTAATAANKKIYTFGGETYSGDVCNILYEIDVEKMEIKVVEGEGIIPGRRCMHTIQAVAEKWLAVFGGRRIAYENNDDCVLDNDNDNDNDPIYYDTKDFYLFYIPYSTWIFPTTLYSAPYPRSYHACAVIDSAMYIYGGQQLTFSTESRRVGNDQIQLDASFSKVENAAYSNRCLRNNVHDDEDLWCFRIPDFWPDSSSSSSSSVLHSGITNDATTITRASSTVFSNSTSEQRSRSPNTIARSSVPLVSYWEKHILPRANGFHFTHIGRRREWIMTKGKAVGRCCGAAMVGMTRRLILFGGWDKDRWDLEVNTFTTRRKRLDGSINQPASASRLDGSNLINKSSAENTGLSNYTDNTVISFGIQSSEPPQPPQPPRQYPRTDQSHSPLPLFDDRLSISDLSSAKRTCDTTKPWEFLKIYLFERNYWIHLHVKGLPEMECVAFISDNLALSNNLFVVGRTRDASNRITMGWIKDE